MKKFIVLLLCLISFAIVGCGDKTPQEVLDAIEIELTVEEDFALPKEAEWRVLSGEAITIEAGTAKVSRPAAGTEDATVVLEAKVEDVTKNFTITVKAYLLTAQGVIASIKLEEVVEADFTLPTEHNVSWTVKSGDAIVIENNIAKVTRPTGDAEEVVLTATVTIDNETESKDFTITVLSLTEFDAVYDVDYPDNYAKYLLNISEKTDKRTEFFDRTQLFTAGTDNPWKCRPIVTFVRIIRGEDGELDFKRDENGQIIETNPTAFDVVINVYLVEDGVEKECPTDYIDEIDTVNGTITFNEHAVDKVLRVKVYPKNLTEKQLENISNYTVEYNITVAAGYNVYDAKEISYIDNRTQGGGVDVNTWKNFKIANKLDHNYQASSLILQDDINVTTADLPSEFFYSENDISKSDADYEKALGSMKDSVFLYLHENSEGEQSLINGNYFKLETSSLREVVRDGNKILAEGQVAISHAVIFWFEGNNTGETTMKNLYIIGNSPRVEDEIKAGGLIIQKVYRTKFNAYNNITTSSFISYFPENTDLQFTVESCKAYDSFNTFVYNWGSPNVLFKDCEMIGAGGPVLIQDHVNAGKADERIADTKFENCKLESYVTGTEGWFSITGATAIVPVLKGLDAIFNAGGRSFLKTKVDGETTLTYLNVICVNKSGSAASITAEKVSGSLQLDEAVFNYGKNNPYLSAVLDQTFALGAPTFETSISTATAGWGYFDGTTVNGAVPINENLQLFGGDYLAIYYSGMMIVVGYYEAGLSYEG